MITINISLSEESIMDAISRLEDIKDRLDDGIEKTVSLLVHEGAMEAKAAYGDWGVDAAEFVEGTTGSIIVYGDMPLIAEFGAGDATINPATVFENSPTTPVYAGSYSLLEGSGEYWFSKAYTGRGFWHFAGKRYTEIEPKQGLAHAKAAILERGTRIAQEVIQL